jgi:membrane protein required for colicin V production
MYDGIMALIVFFTMIHGFWKGAAWQVAPIMSLVLGYMIAMPMSVTSAHYFGDPPLNRLYALVTIYIGVALVVYLMVRSFRAGIDKAKLTEFDRHIGALLGLVKGILLTLAITVGLLIQSPVARELILKSESSTIAAKIINAVYPILPQAMHQILRPYLLQLGTELPLDIHDSDPQNNNNILPDSMPPLTPTHTGARRSPNDDYSPTPRYPRTTVIDDTEDDEPLPPVRTPRQRSTPYNDRAPQANRRYDSASSLNRRSAVDDRYAPAPVDQPTLTPTPSDDDDPFAPDNSTRSRRQGR